MKKAENEEELWDLYTATREKTGKTHRRGDPMGPGEYRLAAHVSIFNSKDQLLIQKRQPWKKGWPNLWDLSVGGSAIAGENSQMAAERETWEELGLRINLDGIRPHFSVNFADGFDDYYFINLDVDIENLLPCLFWTGLSMSEQIPIAWEDIDLEKGTIQISRSYVRGIYRVTKNRRRKRHIKLLQPAVDSLKKQYLLTGNMRGKTIEVLQRDNKTKKVESKKNAKR